MEGHGGTGRNRESKELPPITLCALKAHLPVRCARSEWVLRREFGVPYTPRVHIAEQMQGLRSARKRSLLKVNELFERKRNAADAREMCSQRVGFAEGFLCPSTQRVHIARRVQGLVLILLRSLLKVNEEAKSKA